MGLEASDTLTSIYIDDLNPSYPLGADQKAQGDDHLRLIKRVLKNTFPNISGSVTLTHNEINTPDVLSVTDSVSAPDAVTGRAQIYVDDDDDYLKVKFGDGTIFTISGNTDLHTSAQETAKILETKLDDTEGAVKNFHLDPGNARVLVGNPENYNAPMKHIGVSELLAMISTVFSGTSSSGAFSIPHDSANIPDQNFEFRYGTGTSSASAQTAVTFSTPFPNLCAFVIAVTAGLSSTSLYPATANVFSKSTSGFSINVCSTAGREATTFYYLAIGR